MKGVGVALTHPLTSRTGLKTTPAFVTPGRNSNKSAILGPSNSSLPGWRRPSLLGARTLLGAPGLTTRSKKRLSLLGARTLLPTSVVAAAVAVAVAVVGATV